MKVEATILGLVNPNSSKILDLQKEIIIIPIEALVVLVDLDVMIPLLINTGLE